MEKILTIVFLSFALCLQAQHETLIDDLDVVGAFGGPILEIGSIAGEVGADVGGGGALMLNNLFLGGYGMGTDYPEILVETEIYNVKYSHGGLWFGYTSRPHKLVHLHSSLKVGWGRARLRQEKETVFSDRHFTLIPELGFEVNLMDFFRISVAGGYRLVNGINSLPGLNNEDFNSPVGIITFKFGGFGDAGNWDF